MSESLSVVVLAAGQGTRMQSALPKVLHTIAGKPLLAHVIEDAEALNAERIVVVYGHGGEAVRAALAGRNIHWVEQAQQLGTGHAVAQALPELDDDHTILLLYGDVPLISVETLRTLVQAAAGDCLALLTVEMDEPGAYGRIVRDGAGNVQSIVEQKDASAEQLAIREINTGMLAVKVKPLRQWVSQLQNNNAQSEYYLTDIVGFAVADGVGVKTTRPASLTEIEGVNNKCQLAALERAYQQQQAKDFMQAGLTLRDPARFDVRGELVFGKDVVIDINVLLEGRVVLGNAISIGPNCCLKNVTIGDGSVIEANCVMEDTQMGANCNIGPFARLRPGTALADAVKIGNFVELKKSTVASGSKVNHLSYVGDTTMGSNVNVGAGTITCNYDGANKQQTLIGDNVFIGSNSQLIAPLSIGDGATIGAGSTITHEVPANALSLSRVKQTTTEAWQRPKKQGKE